MTNNFNTELNNRTIGFLCYKIPGKPLEETLSKNHNEAIAAESIAKSILF